STPLFSHILLLRLLSIASFLFFLLLLRPPPRSTLFPYTRSSDLTPFMDLPLAAEAAYFRQPDNKFYVVLAAKIPGSAVAFLQKRSEEHTSELQSRENLVCCLLLETITKPTHRSASYSIA